jgi:hypothetical protein
VTAPTTRPKRNVSEASRAEVLARAECRYCGDRIGPWEVDHLVPVSRGGNSKLENLACACVSCNTQKANFLLHEWMQWRKTHGMFWPPVAQHATDPQHYPDHCTPCQRAYYAALDAWEADPTLPKPPAMVNPVAHTLAFNRNGYKAYYRCDKGHTWTCGWALGTWYYSDCACTYCVTRRLEDES